MPASDDPSAVVRRAAQTLLANLERARSATADWSDENLAKSLVAAALDDSLAILASTRLWGRDNQLLSSQFWHIAGSQLECGRLQNLARTKPRGYAGDFEMLAMLCDHTVWEHPLGRHFDRYFQQQTAVEAVRARTDEIAAAIACHAGDPRASPYVIVSIGSGPAIDIERALRMLPAERRREVGVRLFDLDEAALAHAIMRLSPLLVPSQLVTVRENLFRLAQRPNAAQLITPADFIVCSGLCDYLTDAPAAALVALLWRQLRPGGQLRLGNFAPHNPSRAYMEWIGNWYLLYRTPEQLAALAESAGIPSGQWRIAADRTGVDLFLIADRPVT